MNLDERQLSKKSMERINAKTDDYAKNVFGDKFGTRNDFYSDKYFPKGDAEVYNNADVKSGLFSIGNQKLDDQTLIINFTSALGCPSINHCPITPKACYAAASENRLTDVRRKNLIVQNLVKNAMANNMIDGLFDIAELYIIEAQRTKKPIQYIRYNEAGDFPNQKLLIKAAIFSKKMKEKYGIISMAYTSKKGVDPSQEVEGQPIDTIMAINRSRNDIPHSQDSLNRTFFGIKMQNFSSNPEINLEDSYCDVDYVEDKDAQKLKTEIPMMDQWGHPSIPVLNKGSWDGGSGYYYICPCSFWKYNKEKATRKYLLSIGAISEDEELPKTSKAMSNFLKSRITEEQNEELKKLLSKIKSPCGVKCAVCHDLSGGVTKDGQKNIKDYSILAAIHGPTGKNYKPEYAEAKRNGDDSVVYSKDNPHGRITKYDTNKYKSSSPIRQELFKKTDDNTKEIQKKKDEFKNEMKRFFGTII